MIEKLSAEEARVIGALIEKQLTTPDYYPLSLNALVAACNQKTNRDPVTNLNENTVNKTLDGLREKNLVYVFYGSSSRTPKYKHLAPSFYHLNPPETAIVCVLLLRGAQTLGELRERTSRLHEFPGLNEVNETLEALMKKEEPLVARLEKQPGQKEARFIQLLSEMPENVFVSTIATNVSQSDDERVARLERELENLREEFNLFRQSYEEFKKQFE